MGARYGEAWRRSFGAAPSELAAAEWGRLLECFDRDSIDAGLDADAARGSGFPPSAPQFRMLCEVGDPQARLGENAWDREKAPERWLADERMAREALRAQVSAELDAAGAVEFDPDARLRLERKP